MVVGDAVTAWSSVAALGSRWACPAGTRSVDLGVLAIHRLTARSWRSTCGGESRGNSRLDH